MLSCLGVTHVDDARLHGANEDEILHLMSAADLFLKNEEKCSTFHGPTFYLLHSRVSCSSKILTLCYLDLLTRPFWT